MKFANGIEAVQFRGTLFPESKDEWLTKACREGRISLSEYDYGYLDKKFLHFEDWIVKLPDGELIICHSWDFEETYGKTVENKDFIPRKEANIRSSFSAARQRQLANQGPITLEKVKENQKTMKNV